MNSGLRAIFIAFILVSSLNISGVSSAYQSPDSLSELKVVTEELPPYQYLDENNEATGYSVDVVTELLERANINSQIHFYPWPRTYRMARNANNILVFSIARTEAREQLFHWIGKLYREKYALYALNPSPMKNYKSLEQFRQHSIGVNRSSPNDQFLTQQEFPFIERTADISQTVKMFYEGRVDLLFGSDFALKKQVQNQGYDIKKLHKVFAVPQLDADIYIGMSINSDPELVNRLTSIFKQMTADNELNRLQQKWLILAPEE